MNRGRPNIELKSGLVYLNEMTQNHSGFELLTQPKMSSLRYCEYRSWGVLFYTLTN